MRRRDHSARTVIEGYFSHLAERMEEIVDDAEEYTDLLEERVVQLGGIAGRHRASGRAAHPAQGLFARGRGQHDHVEALSSALAAYGKGVRKAIDETDQLGDRDSADIFTEISRAPTSGCGSLMPTLVD